MTNNLLQLIKNFRWLFLSIAALFLYGLGAALARYLGASPEFWMYIVGQVWVLGVLLTTYFLRRYFDNEDAAENLGTIVWGVLPWKSFLLLAASLCLTIAVAMMFILIRLEAVGQVLLTLMITGILAGVIYSVPPFKLAETGFGALLLSVMVGAGIPTISFLLLNGSFHRFLPMVTFPIAILNLVMLITFDFPTYARDELRGRKTLLTLMGWKNAMVFHNLLVLAAFLLIGVTSMFGFPTFAAFPPFLLLPLAIFQVLMMVRVANGLKPNWNALMIGSTSLFAVLVYIFTFSFWTH